MIQQKSHILSGLVGKSLQAFLCVITRLDYLDCITWTSFLLFRMFSVCRRADRCPVKNSIRYIHSARCLVLPLSCAIFVSNTSLWRNIWFDCDLWWNLCFGCGAIFVLVVVQSMFGWWNICFDCDAIVVFNVMQQSNWLHHIHNKAMIVMQFLPRLWCNFCLNLMQSLQCLWCNLCFDCGAI